MLSIRKATKEDAKAVWEIRNAAILNQCIDHYPADTLRIWTSGALSEAFAIDVEKQLYVAVYNDQVVGTGMIDIETGKLDAIFVHPSRMRNGIGRKIVYYLEVIAMEHGLETLSLESTLNAASFYRACGYEGNDVGKYDSPRGITLDCVPMVKHITPKNE
jgi:ribosomal protein S18 acetylase RimI-like enzyme